MIVELKMDRTPRIKDKFYFSNVETGQLSVNMCELDAARHKNVMRQLGITVNILCNAVYFKEGD